jgi:hypothetical protein
MTNTTHGYFVRTELVIKYYSKAGKINTICTNIKMKKYVHDCFQKNIDIINEELNEKIQKKTYKKILYDNDKWVKKSYKQKYKYHILKTFIDIDKFIQIYKKSTAILNIF